MDDHFKPVSPKDSQVNVSDMIVNPKLANMETAGDLTLKENEDLYSFRSHNLDGSNVPPEPPVDMKVFNWC